MKKLRKFFPSRAAMLLLMTMLTSIGAWAAPAPSQFPTTSGGSGTSEDPYKISSTSDLNQLAEDVNNGITYQDVYFKLTQNITYDTSGMGETESNFTPIGVKSGSNYYAFQGHFNGNGRTISGIRIYRSGDGDADMYLGIFGNVRGSEGNLAEVKRITLKNTKITGYAYCGGIAGNCTYTQITDCHVSDDVTIHAVLPYSSLHGGIVGNTYLNSEISGCTSDATISMADGLTYCSKFGAIAGHNSATIKDCLALPNAKVTGNFYVGAIVGHNEGTLTSNAYTRFGVFGVGTTGSELSKWGSDQEGAQFGKLTIRYKPSDWSSSASTSYTDGLSVYDKGINYGTVGHNNYNCYYTFTTMTDCWGITNGNDGSAEHPYIITTTTGLDLLADQVNKQTNGYYQKYFELGADITYSYTYAWDNASNDNADQNNYTPIGIQLSTSGSDYRFFTGYFDGKGHTVSGIRYYTNGTNYIDGHKGLFARADYEVKNVTLADTRITGHEYCGGIAGESVDNITNCHVGSDVVIRSSNYHGGIVGEAFTNYGITISGCTSAASSSDNNYGGIAGKIPSKVTVKDCLFLGTSLTGSSNVGAIVGNNDGGTLTNNYHTASGVGGVNGADTDGAKYAVGIATLPANIGVEGTTYGESTYTGITAYTNGLKYNSKYYIAPVVLSLADNDDNSTALSTNNGKAAIVTLDGRTLYCDGDWNTLCLPFSLTAAEIAASPLADFTIKKLLDTSNLDGDGKLTLNFEDATTIEAGKPYLVKWVPALIIKNKADWDAFCVRVNDNYETFEGKVVKLADDYDNSGEPITWTVGKNDHPFKGTFDGNGRTLTVGYNTTATRLAPFRYVDGATIKNLTIAGTIKNSTKILGGLVGSSAGNTTISNCRVSATVESTVNGDGTVGGFVAIIDNGQTTIENCLFDGSFEGANTYRWSGFVGWVEAHATPAGRLIVNNSLFAPTTVNIKADSNNCTVYRTHNDYTPSLSNCYYKTTATFGKYQGTDASGMSKETLADNDHLGSGWEISGDNVVPKMNVKITGTDIVNPVFEGVVINAAENPVNFTGGSFKGIYSPETLPKNDKSNLYLGSANKLYWPSANVTLNAFRAYFHVDGGSVSAVKMNFEEEGQTTSLKPLTISPEGERTEAFPREGLDGVWFDLQGRRVAQPTKGLYIVNGKKIVIK